MLRYIAIAAVASVASVASTALVCCAHDYQTVSYAEVTSAPVAIEKYPSAMYKGRPTYLFEDKWYFREGSQWRYFTEEPPPLRKRREQWERGEIDPRRDPHRNEELELQRDEREERELREDRHLVP